MRRIRNSKKAYLTCRISLSATVKTGIKSIKSTMANYPALKQISEGSGLRYIVSINGISDRFYVLELQKSRIVLTINSLSSPSYFLKEAMLNIISISNALSEDYIIDLYGILPYLTAILANFDLIRQEYSVYNFNRESDIILSKRVIELLGLNSSLSSQVEELNSKLINVLSKLIVCKYSNELDPKIVADEQKVEVGIVLAAIDGLRVHGYKVLNGRNGTFEIVRL